ncbi:MAG: sulfatase-like hydrolase/transferase [Chitinophagales bacterium]|nr:sulfatase-like hydrolase/transferase [Chitinophagales bacterium]
MKRINILYILFFICLCIPEEHIAQTPLPHIIFITLDDQNDYTEGFDGHPQVETPNIKRLEELGTTFYNAYCVAPQCGPSRMSLITGKDCFYTSVYNNTGYKCKKFSDNFTAAEGNEEIFVLPQYLKGSAGYFTYHFNKVMHCFENLVDYDSVTTDPCARELSWNKIFYYEDSTLLNLVGHENLEGPKQFSWAVVDDSYENVMEDFVMIDTAISFLQSYANDPSVACNKPLFLGLGFQRPHTPYYTAEKYYNDFYQHDLNQNPLRKPYNFPANAFPFNGIAMPPQPATLFGDYDQLPAGGVAQALADGKIYYNFNQYIEDLYPAPVVDENISETQRLEILNETMRANLVMAYLATIKYVDAQIGRLLDSLEQYPDIYNNTIIIVLGDHGFSMGEKKHWRKGAMWETDVRAPLIYVDLRNPKQQVTENFVSFLDLFPTLCDVTGISYPTFSDGSKYFDGESLLPLIANPDTVFERPVLTTYIEKGLDEQGGCFPQYSVRSGRFHYIKYQTNNAYGVLNCDITKSIIEEELYEIGLNRETDPYEWNNLAANDKYGAVINYLQQFIPDSNLYLQKTITVHIKNNALDCFASRSDTIYASAEIFDKDGNYLAESPPEYTYRWTNDINDLSWEGDAITIPLSLFSEEELINNNRFIIYLQVYDIEDRLIGFDMKYFYAGEENLPTVFYQISADGTTACINNYNITGTFTDSWWDFGEGVNINDEIPGPYNYGETGNYTITNYVQYGNENCIETFTALISVDGSVSDAAKPIHLFPNPANQTVYAALPANTGNGLMRVFAMTGQEIFSAYIPETCCEKFAPIDLTHFAKGSYVVSFMADTGLMTGIFIKD